VPALNAFESERLILRPFEPGDAPALRALLNHPELAGRRGLPHGFNEELPLSASQAEKVIGKWSGDEESLHLAIVLRASQELIGHAELDRGWDPHAPSLWLLITPAHQRQGNGSEILRLLLNYYFEDTPAHNVSLWAADWNQPALDFARKHGFQECGRWRRDDWRNGAYVNGVIFDLLRPEWKAWKVAQTTSATKNVSRRPSTAGFDDPHARRGALAQPSAQDASHTKKEG
jgi:RimJ/RimL family protein N-acetyltransferase